MSTHAQMLEKVEIERRRAETRKFDAETAVREVEIERWQRLRAEEDAGAAAARIFTFYGEVDRSSVATCLVTLGHWSRRDVSAPIKVIFASPGGSILDGLALYDFLRELSDAGHEIETVCLGFALSMGAVLMQAGDRRVMGRNAFMMIHEASDSIAGDLASLAEGVEVIERLQARCVALLASRSSLSEVEIEERWTHRRRGWWLDANEALAIGLCDEIR